MIYYSKSTSTKLLILGGFSVERNIIGFLICLIEKLLETAIKDDDLVPKLLSISLKHIAS